MGDKTYRYPVALRWDQETTELKKVKYKIQKYFQSPRESKGGDCDISETDCRPGYILIYFKEEKDQKSVVQKHHHLVPIKDENSAEDPRKLSLTASLPDAEDMGSSVSSLVGLGGDKGASNSLTDTDHHQEKKPSKEIPKRDNSSMTDSDFKNGDPKRCDMKGRDDSTGWREKDRRDVFAPEGEEQHINSSTPRSSTEKDHKSPEDPSTPGNESQRGFQSKGGKSRPAAPPEDNGTSGSSVDEDRHQENNRSPYSSLTRSGLMEGGPQRPGGASTRNQEWEGYRSYGNEQDIKSSTPGPLRENGDQSGGDSFTVLNESGRELRRPISTEEPGRNHPTFPQEIFKDVTVRLDKEWFTGALQEEIKAEIPSLSIENKSDVVKVTGTFEEIEFVHRYLRGKWEQELGEEKPPETSSDWSPTDNPADHVCFPSALYEYIAEIYRTEIEKIKERYGVKIAHRSTEEGSTYVGFIPRGSESSPEKAKEMFTDKVQKVMDDWSQVTVDPSVVPLTVSEIRARVMGRWSNTLVIQGENTDIVLRGPRDELSQVKVFLETTDHKPSRSRRAVTISTSDMKTEIEVDARHMDILKKLKHREISDIEKKYNVKMEEHTKKGNLLVTFRTTNAPPDLSPHASHCFITLLQKTFFNIQKKEIRVKPEIKEERVNIMQEQLMMAGIDIVMEYSTGTVLLIGHPVHVAFAVEKLTGSQNPGRSQAAIAPEEKMETDSPSAATQKEEEPDKCPICLCEIEDKVVLEKCKHAYCKDCLTQVMAHKPVCSICGVSYGTVTGDQPDGSMTEKTNRNSLPGYPNCGTIEIYYNIPSGIQKENHPRPGSSFSGAHRTAYLPDNKEGRDILRLLKKAFNQKLIFTVGDSRTTGATDTVTWNDIHHKTSMTGGPQCFGYPDPDYLNRVRDELKAKGVE